MDKFLETQNLPRLNHEDMENYSSTVTSRDWIHNWVPPNKSNSITD